MVMNETGTSEFESKVIEVGIKWRLDRMKEFFDEQTQRFALRLI
jgi:hypothetical protein